MFIFVRGSFDPRAIVWPEGSSRWKIPVIPSGIEPATFKLVARQCYGCRFIFLSCWYDCITDVRYCSYEVLTQYRHTWQRCCSRCIILSFQYECTTDVRYFSFQVLVSPGVWDTEEGISHEWVGSIIHEDLDVRKLSVKWVLKCLNVDQIRQWCQSSEQILEFFQRDPNDFLRQLVTTDET